MFLVRGELVGGTLPPVVGQVVLHCELHLRGEGAVVVIGAWTDPRLVEHTVQCYFVQTFL